MALQNAYFQNLKTGDKIEVQFNPTDLTFSKTAQFSEIAIPGLDSPILQFIRGGNETLTMELFFDTTDSGMGEGAKDVTERTDQFYNLVKQDPDTHAPPVCRFSWGEPAKEAGQEGKSVSNAPSWFTCIVEGVDRKFLLFSPAGIPLRARLTVKMREYKTIKQMVAELHSADYTKARVLKRRERLDQISASEYDTPAEWRRIAEENKLDDPRRVLPGTILKIPPLRVESAIRRSR
jgi:nucleoid-associated protein YgaU